MSNLPRLAVICLMLISVAVVAQRESMHDDNEEAVVQEVVEDESTTSSDHDNEEEEEMTNEQANQLLQEIIRYGIDQSDFLTEVQERELYNEGIKLVKSDPAHFVAIFNKQKKQSTELSKFAYASLEASDLLAKQFMLTRQQIVYGLERVELRQTDLFQRCPRSLANAAKSRSRSGRQLEESSVDCPPASHPYRTPDGSCNNMDNPEWGTSYSPFLRFLPPVYGDSLGNEIRTPVRRNDRNNLELPSPRRVSAAIHRDSPADTLQFSMMVMQWGQFVDHDITFTPQKRGFNDSLIKCCDSNGSPLPENLRHRDCMPITIPTDDPFYSQFNRTCMDFVRSTPAIKPDCSLGFRDQINQVTSYIDGSNIYGSSQEEMDDLRLFEGGKLRYTDLHIRKSLLPALDHSTATEECRISTPNLYCFHAGDERSNEQPALTGMHTLWLREHNRLVRMLSEINPHWDDETLFQEARKIVGAMQQHITYNEWLPIVLGPRVLDIFELRLSPRGHYSGYNETINPTVANAFGTAALRFGHSLIRKTLTRCNRNYVEVPYNVRLHKELNNPANIHNFGSVDRILLGLVSKNIARRDEFITTEVTNHLFQNPRTPYGMDLAALNIQRGRDHGLAPYNVWREQCGLQRFRRFDDMTSVISSATVRRLQQVYDHVDDVDLFTGGLAERPVVGGLVGPTFACILGQQFLNLRKGDRFWYENSNVFTLEQLQEIRKTSLARTICDNLDDVETIQPFAFLMIDEHSNRRMSCKGRGIPRINLRRWREIPRPKSGSGIDISFETNHLYSANNIVKTSENEDPGDDEVPKRPDFSGSWTTLDDEEEVVFGNHEGPLLYSPQILVRLRGGVNGNNQNNNGDRRPFPADVTTSTFTPEVPKQLTRDQYYTFFDKNNFDDNDDEKSEQISKRPTGGHLADVRESEWSLPEATTKSERIHRVSSIITPHSSKGRSIQASSRERFVRKLFSDMLKPADTDKDFGLRPKLFY